MRLNAGLWFLHEDFDIEDTLLCEQYDNESMAVYHVLSRVASKAITSEVGRSVPKVKAYLLEIANKRHKREHFEDDQKYLDFVNTLEERVDDIAKEIVSDSRKKMDSLDFEVF